MAGKLSSEKAFRLINPAGQSEEAEQPHAEPGFDDPSQQTPTLPSARWKRYLLFSVVTLVAISFAGTILYGISLILNKEPPSLILTPTEEKINPLSQEKASSLARQTMTGFLNSTTTEERLQYVMHPDECRDALNDYYKTRHHFDSPLWKIDRIEAAQYDGQPIWMLAYVSLNKQRSHAVLQQEGDALKIHWQASYAYGEISWEQFALTQPEKPVQMRAYVTPHLGPLPPGTTEKSHIALTIENKQGAFTGLAIMEKGAEGASLMSKIPPDARVPVNLRLYYQHQANGIKQLSIHSLLHFQWIRPPLGEMGTPFQLQR
ncbi:hypothetical protein HW115_13495 [Verrucomicrobiaceae bacterium N1E253]|uniref:Uncharacterized protein n=1 Tax=Oceaniferula marina TaxID=2748318 RepID=A0A851GLC0_9BACT|nr:hypothetical protein [Oceaniferula marina]NWK56631.1 hypothetical protein [Oceaniferula marina]